jgi:hypothetical protein
MTAWSYLYDWEESPGTIEQNARENEWAVKSKNSATENKPPARVRVKSCGKSARVRMATYVCGKPRLVQTEWTEYAITLLRVHTRFLRLDRLSSSTEPGL